MLKLIYLDILVEQFQTLVLCFFQIICHSHNFSLITEFFHSLFNSIFTNINIRNPGFVIFLLIVLFNINFQFLKFTANKVRNLKIDLLHNQ